MIQAGKSYDDGGRRSPKEHTVRERFPEGERIADSIADEHSDTAVGNDRGAYRGRTPAGEQAADNGCKLGSAGAGEADPDGANVEAKPIEKPGERSAYAGGVCEALDVGVGIVGVWLSHYLPQEIVGERGVDSVATTSPKACGYREEPTASFHGGGKD